MSPQLHILSSSTRSSTADVRAKPLTSADDPPHRRTLRNAKGPPPRSQAASQLSLPGPPFFLTCRNVVATLIPNRSPRDSYVLDLSEWDSYKKLSEYKLTLVDLIALMYQS